MVYESGLTNSPSEKQGQSGNETGGKRNFAPVHQPSRRLIFIGNVFMEIRPSGRPQVARTLLRVALRPLQVAGVLQTVRQIFHIQTAPPRQLRQPMLPTLFQTANAAPALARAFSASTAVLGRVHGQNKYDKYHKILRYTKPINTKVYQAGDVLRKIEKVESAAQQYPKYAYETQFFKRQNRGLYGGAQITRSKNCSEAGNKSLRTHKPNIVKTKLWSEALNKQVCTRVSTSVLKIITKEGGLDRYLTKDKPARIKTLGLKGWRLRYDVLKKHEHEDLQKGLDSPDKTVFYIHPDGKHVTVGRNRLLRELYPLVYKDSYEPLEWSHYLRTHRHLTFAELTAKLEHYNFDFAPVTI